MNKKITILIALVFLAGILTLSTKVEPAKATTWNFTLYGSASQGWGFSPATMDNPGPTISVNQGDIVNLTLVSQDAFTHRFWVDYNDNTIIDTGEPLSDFFTNAAPITYQFTANTNGTFTYYCTVHPLTMSGGFTVVPEFPTAAILPVFVILTLVAVIALRKTSAHNSANE